MKKIRHQALLALGILALSLKPAFAGSSQFIENMPQLEQDPDRPGAMSWMKPGLDRAAYTMVMIEPITIFINPDSEYKGLNADDMKTLADEFVKTLTLTLEPEVPVLHKGGPGILYLRAALVDVKLAKKKRGLLSFTPIGLVVHAAEEAAGANIDLKNAVLEIEALDSVSGERLGVIVDKAPETAEKEKLSWDSIKATFAFYAERFKTRMQAAEKKQ
jgi:hypothetical protein